MNNHKPVNHFENQIWNATKKARKNDSLSSFNETTCLDHDHCHFCSVWGNVVMCVCSLFDLFFFVYVLFRFVCTISRLANYSIIWKWNSNVRKEWNKKFMCKHSEMLKITDIQTNERTNKRIPAIHRSH